MPGDWNDYRYFLAVVRTGSLSAAARRLRVDQSTVGRRLAALEGQVGARLFDHTPQGYVLTPAGDSVRARVERLEEGFLAVERQLAGGDARLEGVVRLATTEALATTLLVPQLGKLRARHPGLSIELCTSHQPVSLARRQADVAVRLGAPPKEPNLLVRRIGVAGFALYAALSYLARRGRPRLRGGLRDHEIVGYSGDLAAAPIARWMIERAHQAEIVFRTDSIGAAHQAVAAGIGLGVLPCLLGAGLTRIGSSLAGTAPIWTVVHQDLQRNARVRAVLLFLSELVRQQHRALAGG